MKRVAAPSLLLLVAICAVAQQPRFDGKTWWHHVEVLAADNMEGRGTGSPGLQRAEAYVVDKHDDDVWRAQRRAQGTDRRRTCIACIERWRGFRLRLRDRQDRAAIDRGLRPRSFERAECREKRGFSSR